MGMRRGVHDDSCYRILNQIIELLNNPAAATNEAESSSQSDGNQDVQNTESELKVDDS